MLALRSSLIRLVLLAIVLVPLNAFAWIDTGHMIVASIAYRYLTPRVRAEVNELLKVGGDSRTTTFYGAACWADDFKDRKTARWHFIDNYFRSDGKPASNKPEDENVVWAIHKFSDILADTKQPTLDRAEALRYVMHFVGDIHQPLHCVSRETDDMPQGDAGGNKFPIGRVEHIGMWHPCLHELWDWACGFYEHVSRPLIPPDKDKIDGYAEQITNDFPLAKLPSAKDLKVEDWMSESVVVAKQYVYAGIQPNDTPSAAYLERGRVVCEQRLALAGYRLAQVLNTAMAKG